MLKSAMGTRAASFSAKIRSLQDYHHRLLNGLSPLPSGVDIINVLKFFSQALLTILRDIPSIPIDLLRDPSRDTVRVNFFPNLDYRTLYHALAQLLDSFASIQAALGVSAPAVFDYLLHALVCLVPFLEHELMDCMPMTVARTISLNFVSHQDIIDMLCYNILPFTLYHTDHYDVDENDSGAGGEICFANESIPSILMIVFSHTDCLALHSQLLECLMRLKSNIIQDLLVVIAYGTGKARHAAVEILFQYWPGLNPSVLDRKALSEKHVPWKPLTCQNETCQNTFNNEAVKICFAQIETAKDPSVQTSDCRGRPPIPLLICIECAELVREHALVQQSRISMKIVTGSSQANQQRLTDNVLLNVLHPLTEICYTCESKNCLSLSCAPTASSTKYQATSQFTAQQAQAVVTCFAPDCTAFNSNKPVRLCLKCHEDRHNHKSIHDSQEIKSPEHRENIAARHLVQEHLQSLWHLPPDAQLHFSEAVIALLREAAILEKSKDDRRGGGGIHTSGPGFASGIGGGPLGPGSTAFGPGPGLSVGGIGPGAGLSGFGPDGAGSGPGPGLGALSSEGTDSTVEERQLLSRYGIWLLIGLVEPSEADTPEKLELLGRMLAMLCNWFHNTACLPDDQAGSALERIKSESIQGWLLRVIASQFQLFASCLIPAPPDFAQIGGHWESWPSMTIQIKEGFKRLLCLVPYDIITADIWAYIMPFWMESFRYDLAEAELAELKILLSKVLDPDLSPLGLPPKQMYHFIAVCFESNMMPAEQEQALSWLQILTLLEIPVPINLLNAMFLSGIQSFVNLRELKQRKTQSNLAAAASQVINNAGVMETDLNEFPSESEVGEIEDEEEFGSKSPLSLGSVSIEAIVESQLACFVLMLDILLKQFELQEITAHKGFGIGKDSINTIKLMLEMISVAKCTASVGHVHTCSVDMNENIKPTPDPKSQDPPSRSHTPTGPSNMRRPVNKPTSCLNECFFCELSSIWYQLSTQLITYFAPLVEITVMSDISATVPSSGATPDGKSSKKVKNNQSPALNSIHEEQDLGEPASISTSEADDDEEPSCFEDDDDRMLSSVELSQTEQLTMKLLQELELQSDPDVIYHMLQCIKLLALHAGILAAIARDEQRRRFFLWLQNRLLIPTFWRLLQAEFSQISQNAVPLLLHCVALPGGGAVFGKLVNEDFATTEWCSRFAAIERVAAFSQFLESGSVKASSSLQTALASVAVHMIHTMDDVNGAVAQRALLAIEGMRAASLKLYVWCLELQFDLVKVDRCLILGSLLQLFNHFHERRVLTWDFFLNRFDALFLEAQISQQNPSEQLPIRDLRNTNFHSETYKKKIQRAQEALAQSHLKRSLLPAHSRGMRGGSGSDTRSQAMTVSTTGHTPTPPPALHSASNTPTNAHSSSHSSSSGFAKKFQALHTGGHGKESKLAKLSGASGTPALLTTGSSSGAANRKSSKLAALTGSAFPNNFFHDSGSGVAKRDAVAEEFAIFSVIHRALDDDETADHETLHLLVFLFMQFLSWPDSQHPVDEKSLNRTQIIVFRHLNTMLGYSVEENQFFMTAFEMRSKTTFSAFLSALPDVLDSNLHIGAQLLSTALPILVFSPAHDRFCYTPNPDDARPEYSLWLLPPHLRASWLESTIVILYKHAYAQNNVYSRFIELLIQIIMNTLDKALEHRCAMVDVFRHTRELAKPSQTREESDETIKSQVRTKVVKSPISSAVVQPKIELTPNIVKKPSTDHVAIDIPEPEPKPQLPEQEATSIDDGVEAEPDQSEESNQLPTAGQIVPNQSNLPETSPPQDIELLEDISEASTTLMSCSACGCCPGSPSSIIADCPMCQQQGLFTDVTAQSSSNEAQSESYIPVERLLPIGGELAEPVKKILAQRKQSQPITGSECCCCCCDQPESASGSKCCSEYRQTLEAFQVNERLLPIGPGRPDSADSKKLKQTFKRQQTTIGSPELLPKTLTPPMMSSKSVDSVEVKDHSDIKAETSSIVMSSAAVSEPEKSPEESSKKKNKKNKKKKSKKVKKFKNGRSDESVATLVGTPSSPPTQPQTLEHKRASSSGRIENGKDSSSSHSDISTSNMPSSGHKCSSANVTQFHACGVCGAPIEKFDEHELGLCLVSLATFVHREPGLAAPMLPQILKLASRYALRRAYPWQLESNVHLPGNTMSIARQFIRCTLHQLLTNGIFRQIFQSHLSDVVLFRAIAVALSDFVELNQVSPLKELFEGLVEEKSLPGLQAILQTLSNVATYLECVFVDYNSITGTGPSNGLSHAHVAAGISPAICSLLGVSGMGPGPSGAHGVFGGIGVAGGTTGGAVVANQPWTDLIPPFEAYLRRLQLSLAHLAPSIHNLVPVMRTLLALFKIPGIGGHRSILDPTTKILTHSVAHSPMLIEHVRELSVLCARAFVRDRERLVVARTFALELVQALRFRTQLPDENVLLLVQWALEDVGGTMPPSIAAASLEKTQTKALGTSGLTVEPLSTNAADALRHHIPELLDFISDVHALARIKSNFQGTLIHLNEETLGSHLKAGISQFVALELTRSGGSDHRAILKFMPWLYSLPSLQQGSKEFLECISHVRLLAWVLLGSLQHSALMKVHPNPSVCLVSQPIPMEASHHIAEHVQAVLAGFAEQSKASVSAMSSLFYAFLLCQLWTVYCEQLASQNPPGSEEAHQSILILIEFWAKVTPGVLQLICYSRTEGLQQLADTVSLHFLSLLETLMECSSEILARLLPLWLPLFNSYQGQLSGTIRMRLQGVVSWPCPAQTRDDAMLVSTVLIRWLQKIQTKMSQIEMQSSTATQLYCV